MNYLPNQNGKVLEETQAGSNADVVKTTTRCLRYFKMTLPLYQVFKNLSSFLSLCHIK